MSDVKILVLGGSGSGKTCFMLGMYDDMRLGYGGFTFSATDIDVDRRLVDRFRTLFETRGEARWPPPTSQLEHYEFSLNYALRRFMVFDWHDYRGGMIAATGEPYQQVRDLMAEADVAMICAPGDLLHDAAFGRHRGSQRELLIAEIQQLMEADGDVRPSIIILVTKFDEFAARCRLADPGADSAAIEALLVEAVGQQYQTVFARGGRWRVLICPVSLGPGLAGDNLNSAAIDPQNMHIPVMYAYHEHARDLAQAWASRITAKAGEVEDLKRGMFGGRFTRNRTRSALGDLETLEGHFRTVQERLSIVIDQMPDSTLFFQDGGKAELA